MHHDSRSVQEIARGFLILGVLHVHVMYALSYSVGSPEMSPMAWMKIKVLSPGVAAFFVLAGMGSKHLAARPTRLVLSKSLMLWLLTVVSHILGVALSHLVYEEWVSWRAFAMTVIKPIVYGTGYATFVSWFFTVLATVRVLVHLLGRLPWLFLPVVLALVALLLAANARGLPDNLHEWRNWPAAFLLFLIGMRIPNNLTVPQWAGPLAFVAACLIGMINSPTLLSHGPEWNREPTFVAEPMIGRFGFAPLFFLQIAAAMVFLIWLGRTAYGTLPGRILRYFGSNSLQILLLHGLVIVSLYPLATRLFPDRESIILFVAILIVNPALHALIYRLAQQPLHGMIRACGRLSGRMVDAAFDLWPFRSRIGSGA
jgi:peptidoglycan/LPS O-acetylase OafA/YrhL